MTVPFSLLPAADPTTLADTDLTAISQFAATAPSTRKLTLAQLRTKIGMPGVNLCAGPFNADPTGLTDATAAFQAALTAAAGGTLVVPPGTYLISAELAVPSNTQIVGYGMPVLKPSARFRSFFALLNVSKIRFRGIKFDLGFATLPGYVLADFPTVYNAAVYASGSVDITGEQIEFTQLYTNALVFTNCNGTIRFNTVDFVSPAQTQTLKCEHVSIQSTAGDFFFSDVTMNNVAPATAGSGVPGFQGAGITGSVTIDRVKMNYCGRDASGGGTTHQLEPFAFYDNCVNVSVTNVKCFNSLYGFVRLANTAHADVSGFNVTYASIADQSQQTFSVESTGINFLPGAGTVTIAGGAGAATFSTSQAGTLVNGSLVAVGNILYVLSGFNGTTLGTLVGAPNQATAAFSTQVGGTQASCQDIDIHDGVIRDDYSPQRKGVQIGAYDYAVPVMGVRVHDIEFVNIKTTVLLGGPYQDVRLERLGARGLYGAQIAVTANPGGVTVTATKGVTEANSVCTDLVIGAITQDVQVSGAVPINIDFTSTHSYAGTIGSMRVEQVLTRMAGSIASIAQWLVYRGIAGQGRLTVRGCEMDNYVYGMDVANVSELTIEDNRSRNIAPANFLLSSGTIGVINRSRNRLTAGASSGRAVLVAGTVTVNTAEVLAGDSIRLTRDVGGGTARGELEVGTIVAGTSFVINAKTAANVVETNDTSTIFWDIVH